MYIFFGAEKPTHMVRTYPYVKYMKYPPRGFLKKGFLIVVQSFLNAKMS